MNERMNERMNQWINESMNQWINEFCESVNFEDCSSVENRLSDGKDIIVEDNDVTRFLSLQ
jgi:hypothetical protein